MPVPLSVQVLAHAPTAYFHCQHCEVVWEGAELGPALRREQLGAGLPEEMLREHARVLDWARRLAAAHAGRLSIEMIDVASVRGFWKALRHRARRYPAVIVDGRLEPDLGSAEAAIASRLPAA